ncbi:MarR family transcriptional regulator [Rapidithrix thailandica]|uniref:MarR family transcriptional regulator n=1 Tax=Rapidithrix thailandica TaxID=413964 RepID=A0AAW9S4U2_9BACT
MKFEESIKQETFSSPQIKALLNMMYTANWFMGKQTELLKPYKLSPQQYNVLRILRGSHPNKLTVHSIKERMLYKTPNMTRLVDKLIAQELVIREGCIEDRRVVYVGISQNGLDLMSQLDETLSVFDTILQTWGEEEAELISEAMDRLRTQ